MPNWVPGEGSSTAKLMVIGEAPGVHEDEQGKPFVGPSGELVTEMLSKAGISRESCYITNVCKIRPPDNDIGRLSELGKSLSDFEPILWNEINSIQPNAILALGGVALKTLTGKTKITEQRGSVLQSIQGYPKVIPSIHPANLLEHRSEGMFKWRDKTYIQLDFNKAVRESEFKEFQLPQRNLWVCRNATDFIRFIERNYQIGKTSVDVEVYKSTPICIGFAFTKDEGVSIPLVDILSDLNPKGLTLSTTAMLWKIIMEVLHDEKIRKIGHNFKFDQRILELFGFRVNSFYSDTMLKFHCLYPEFPKRLEFITSIFTDEPFYKSELREYNPKKDDFSRVLLYNAKDNAVQTEIDDVLEGELIESGLKDYFYGHMMKLHDFYMDMESWGIKLNRERYEANVAKYKKKVQEIEERLNSLVGYPINPDSNPQMCQLLYNELHLPKRTRRREKGHSTLTADEAALMSLLANAKMSIEKKYILETTLEHRGVRKSLSDYFGVPKKENTKVHYADKDNRVRTSVLITGTDTFRTSTNKLDPPVRPGIWGLAFQTITKHTKQGNDIRSQFVASEGYALVEADQSQAESRIALLLARENELLKKMDEIDIHTLTASWINGRSYEEQLALKDNLQRQLGKHSGHAYDNGVGKKRLVEMVYHHSDGEIVISEWRAGKILDILYHYKPGIKDVFHKEIQECLIKDCTLWNPWGARRKFFDRLDDEMFKMAYAHIKQSTVTGLTQRAGIAIKARCPYVRTLMESHDSLLFEIPIPKLDDTLPIIKEEFEQEVDFSRCSLPREKLIIPCEIKVSFTSWSEMVKYGSESKLQNVL